MISIYCDGACKGNPGPGGFGVVVIRDDSVIYYEKSSCDETTNNREELKALIRALEKAQELNEESTIYSDSSYAVCTYNEWMFNGKNRKNMDLISLLQKYYITNIFLCQVKKVSGHSQIPGNELADMLATGCSDLSFAAAAKRYNLNLDVSNS